MKNIWIDCDPGIDDAIMLAMAGANQDTLKIHGISTVAGNVSSDKVTNAALGVSRFFGMEEVPVYRGARQPLQKVYVDCEDAHGENGLGGVEFPAGDKQEMKEDAIITMVHAIKQTLPRKMTIIATGPLTNIALLLREYPDVKENIEEIIWMGGSCEEGNMTDFAEFNSFVDPHAVKIVFGSNVPIVMCDLKMTQQCRIYKDQIRELAEHANEKVSTVGRMLRFYGDTIYFEGMDYIEVYDAATILYLLHPEIQKGHRVRVETIVDGEKEGQTNCITDSDGNVYLPTEVDMEYCNKAIMDVLKSIR